MPFDILETAPSVSLLSKFVAETLQKTTSRLPKTEHRKTSPERKTEIGIVATDFKFSGDVTSFEDFWDALLTGRVVTKSMPEQRKKLIGTAQDFQVSNNCSFVYPKFRRDSWGQMCLDLIVDSSGFRKKKHSSWIPNIVFFFIVPTMLGRRLVTQL